MKSLCKKFFVLALFFLSFQSFAVSVGSRVKESRIENGLSVFSLEDHSNPQVRAELCIRAGYSDQNVQDAGFFTLLANLIKKTSRLTFDSVQVTPDATRFILIVSPLEIGDVFTELADSVFNPFFSNEILSSELASLKREVMLNSTDAGTIMNAGIDARVFSSEPWRNDSGIYPQLFSKLSENEVRLMISRIQEKFYVPGNAALFVSGNIKNEFILNEAEKAFGNYFSTVKVSHRPLMIPGGGKKRFIIHGKDFSDELTQVVVQFENFTEEESLVAEQIYNNDYSRMKRRLCEIERLSIPGTEYVDVSSAYKTGTTRLVVQSLLMNRKDFSPASQAGEFLEVLQESGRIGFEEYSSALAGLSFQLSRKLSSSSAYMDALADMWVKNAYGSTGELPQERLENRVNDFHAVSFERISDVIANDDPFVFVILNTKNFTKYKKEFSAVGFEEINSKNASWWTDSLYKNTKTLIELQRKAEKQKEKAVTESPDYEENFLKANEESFSKMILSNGIPVFMKRNENTTGVTLLISISGGNLRTADDYGFEEVMTNVLTMNVLRQINRRQYEGFILNDFNIFSETEMDSSRIVIECETEDLYTIINAVAQSLAMDEVIPSDADRIVQGRRTRKRLENGSTANQLYSAGIASLLPGTPYTKIFETQKEILEKTSYEFILHEYPNLLDPKRYSLILSGNFDEEISRQIVSDAFSVFADKSYKTSVKNDEFMKTKVAFKNFPKGTQKKVKLNHTFLTDIPAKDAGPMPAVLIPTKSFADPVLYFAASPEPGTEEFYAFNALLPYIQEKLSAGAEEKMYLYNCKVSVSKATDHMPAAAFSFSSVEKTGACDNLYSEVIQKLKDDLLSIRDCSKTIQNIRTRYIASEFSEACTNTGTAYLMDESLHENYGGNNILNYLEKYKAANGLTTEMALDVIGKYLEPECLFRIYSSEARK